MTAAPASAPQAPAAAPPPPWSPAGTAGRVDHIRALYVQTPATLTGNLVGMVLMTAIFGPLAEAWKMLGWLAVAGTLWLLRLAHYVRFRRQRDADSGTLRLWRRSWMALVLAQGALWGVAVWLFWGLGTPYHVVSLILIVYSYCLGSVQLLATQPAAAKAE